MNRFACQACALAMVSLTLANAATESPRQNRSANEQTAQVLKIEKEGILAVLRGMGGGTCDLDNPATTSCTITVKFKEFEGKMYCIAIAPEVTGKVQPGHGNGDNIKNIVWRLDPTMYDGRVLEFHTDAGIVTTFNAKGLIVAKSGAHGDGSAAGPKSVYHVKARRNIKGDAEYLPVVMWGTKNGDELVDADLCAAPDPKIGNN